MSIQYSFKGKIKNLYLTIDEYMDAHFPSLEFLYALFFVAIELFFLIRWLDLPLWIQTNSVQFSNIIISMDAALLGFVLTTISILYALPDSNKIKILKESVWYKRIFDVFLRSIISFFITIIYMLFILFLPKDLEAGRFIFIFSIALYFINLSFIHLRRCVWVLKNLFEIITKENQNIAKNQN